MNTFGLRAYYRPTQFSRISLEYHTTNEFRRGGNKFDLQPHETDITEQTKHIINSGGLTYDVFSMSTSTSFLYMLRLSTPTVTAITGQTRRRMHTEKPKT